MRNLIKLIIISALFIPIAIGCTVDMVQDEQPYAIVYGISRYNPAFPEGVGINLEYADDDASSVAQLLESRGYTVVTRLDEEASLEQLKTDINDASAVITEKDTFVFYYSGHGAQADLMGLEDTQGLEPISADGYDEWIFLHGSLPLSEDIEDTLNATVNDDQLYSLLKSLPTPKKIVLIDACNSGGFIGSSADLDNSPSNYLGELGEQDLEVLQKAFYLYMDFPSTQSRDLDSSEIAVIASAGEQEYAWEYQTLAHGIFTSHLLETPELGDLNSDGYVTLIEIYSYIAEQIDTKWNSQVGESMQFYPHISGGPVDFILFQAD